MPSSWCIEGQYIFIYIVPLNWSNYWGALRVKPKPKARTARDLRSKPESKAKSDIVMESGERARWVPSQKIFENSNLKPCNLVCSSSEIVSFFTQWREMDTGHISTPGPQPSSATYVQGRRIHDHPKNYIGLCQTWRSYRRSLIQPLFQMSFNFWTFISKVISGAINWILLSKSWII